MEDAASVLKIMSDPYLSSGDSYTDQLNSIYTTFMLTTFSTMIAALYFVHVPIVCWCPAHFDDTHAEFTDKVTTNDLCHSEMIQGRV